MNNKFMKIRVKSLSGNAKLPSFAHGTDAGADLFSAENLKLEPGKRALVSTGIALEIPEGFAGLIWDKSGIASKSGISTMAGVIDSGYRGEIKVLLVNLSDTEYKIEEGDKIAQILFQKIEHPDFEEVQELSKADRGEKGFGSTGRK